MLQIPKNVMQIGEINAHTKIYMEDYVHTFVERIRDNETFLVFGKKDERSDVLIYLIYGVEKKTDWDRGSYPYFKKYDRLGTLERIDGKSVFKPIRGSGIVLNDYFIFYEQNEDMQSYMIAAKETDEMSRSEDKDKVIEEVAARREARRMEREAMPVKVKAVEKKPAHHWTFPELCRIGCLALILVLVATALTSVNRYPDMKAVVEIFSSAAQSIQNDENAAKPEVNSLVVEEKREKLQAEAAEIPVETAGEISAVEITTAEELQETQIHQEQIVKENDAGEIEDEAEVVSANAQPVSYIVKKGDNLAEIIRNHYGTTARLWEICELNGIEDPDQILPGQNILLP